MDKKTRLVPVEEASRVLGISVRTLEKQVRDGTRDGVVGKPYMVAVDVRLLDEEGGITTIVPKGEETPVVTIQVEGVGAVEADDEVQDLIRKKAKAVLARQISEIEAGYVTTEEVDAFRAQQANLNARDKAATARERDHVDSSSQENDLDDREEQITALEAELHDRITAFKKQDDARGEFLRKYDQAVDIANEQHTKILDLVRFLISVRETLKRTMKGARGRISPKDATALIWKHLDVWNAIYGAWIVDDKGLVLIDGRPVPSWFQEEQFKIDHPETPILTIPIDSSRLNIPKPRGDKDD